MPITCFLQVLHRLDHTRFRGGASTAPAPEYTRMLHLETTKVRNEPMKITLFFIINNMLFTMRHHDMLLGQDEGYKSLASLASLQDAEIHRRTIHYSTRIF